MCIRDSSNRDLHMLQVARGGQFPMVTVRTYLPEDASESATIHADLEAVSYTHLDVYKRQQQWCFLCHCTHMSNKETKADQQIGDGRNEAQD